MSRLIKCYGYCNGTYPIGELVKVGSKNHCKPCAEIKEKEIADRKLLYNTIQKIFNIPFPTAFMLRQMKMFKEERNYTYEGMTKALCYVIKVMKISPDHKKGLGILPYYYDSAIDHYKQLEQRRENVKSATHGEVKRIKISELKYTNVEEVKKRAFVNMEGLV